MRFVEKTGKTVEEAINACLNELGVERDRVRIEVLDEPTKKGLFGLLGTTLAKVRVSYEDCLGELACSFLKDVCNSMGVSAEFNYTQQGQHWLVDISGEELGILIGRRGDTLEA
ncbi:MAG TPA: protein jag, partial [Desulfitobacterium dehalogenans]|nr:protein jag [Desulfitobacterium dehalogenans]